MLKVKVIDVTLTEMMVLGILTELSFLFVETDWSWTHWIYYCSECVCNVAFFSVI